MRVLVFGTFDHLHPGHEFLLTEASKRGDLSVVVARDRTVEIIKGKKAQQHESERKVAIEKKFPEAEVHLGDPNNYLAPVRSIAPDLILLGYDQQLPPGVSEKDFSCPMERLPAYKPKEFKSSIRRK